jgi:predicted DCC family thiol-disulfide oxidoreductase YuxK
MDNRHVIIFDGICRFCSGAVSFIIKRDPRGLFAFTPMQSDIAQKLMETHADAELGSDTILLIKDGVCYVRTDAALEIAKDLSGLWFLFRVFKVVPRAVRDYIYRVFSRHRYSLFGKRESCMIPTADIRSRFLE